MKYYQLKFYHELCKDFIRMDTSINFYLNQLEPETGFSNDVPTHFITFIHRTPIGPGPDLGFYRGRRKILGMDRFLSNSGRYL